MPDFDSPPRLDTPLRRFPWVLVRFRCAGCKRAGDARLSSLSDRYGAATPLTALLSIFVSGCPYDPHSRLRKPQKYGSRCHAYLPDLARGGPPDLPPGMSGLTLIQGGRDAMLPAEPGAVPARRRVGGEME